MDNISLSELENTANQAYQEYWAAKEAYEAALERKNALQELYNRKMTEYMYGDGNVQDQAMAKATEQGLDNAVEEALRCEKALAAAAEAAQNAQTAVDGKKELLRSTAQQDTTFAVYCARMECSCGMRDSYLLMLPTHGVYTRQAPQMTAGDALARFNIPNFGGCKSEENPTRKSAAEEVARNANEAIAEEKSAADFVAKCLSGGGKVDVADSLMEKCVGICRPCFPEGAQWKGGHEKVYVNGEQVLLRRCTLRCNYGGQITILLSGQPE